MNDLIYSTAKLECAQIDCDKTSSVFYTPVIQLWAKGHKQGSHEPAEMKLGAFFCASCKIKIKDSEFMTQWFSDTAKVEIDKTSLAIGKAAFNWSSAKIKWFKM